MSVGISENMLSSVLFIASIVPQWYRIYGVSGYLQVNIFSASSCHELVNVIDQVTSWFHCGVCSLGLVTTDIVGKMLDVGFLTTYTIWAEFRLCFG